MASEKPVQVFVIESRPASRREDYNAYTWKPFDVSTQRGKARKRIKILRDAYPKRAFRITPYTQKGKE